MYSLSFSCMKRSPPDSIKNLPECNRDITPETSNPAKVQIMHNFKF